MSNIVIQKTYTISGDNMSRVTIPVEHFIEEGDSVYLHASAVPNYMSALLIGRVQDRRGGRVERLLAHTDVIQQLVSLRNEKITELLTKKDDVEQLSLFDDERSTKRIKIDNKVDMPPNVAINAPTIGDVEGIPIKVMMSWRKTAPLYVELTVDVISYMRSACQWQINHANIHRGREEKKHSEKALVDNEGHEDNAIANGNEHDPESDNEVSSPSPLLDAEIMEEVRVDEAPEESLDHQSFEAEFALISASVETAPTSSSSGLSSGKADAPDASRPKGVNPRRSNAITSYFAKKVA